MIKSRALKSLGTMTLALYLILSGLSQAIGLLPETLRLLTQQLLTLDLQGALTTIETALIGTVVAVGRMAVGWR